MCLRKSRIVSGSKIVGGGVKLTGAKSARCAWFADSTTLLARGPHPPRFELELLSRELLETAAWPGISSRSSTASKTERLIQPRMSRAPISFLHMIRIIPHNPRACQQSTAVVARFVKRRSAWRKLTLGFVRAQPCATTKTQIFVVRENHN